MWALCPSYFDNDSPIDLRKKVVLQRDLEEQKLSRRPEKPLTPKDDDIVEEEREKWQQQTVLPLGKLYPFMSERYGVRCALISSEYHERTLDSRPGSRGSLEETIRKLHYNSRFKNNGDYPKSRCRSLDAYPDRKQRKQENQKHKRLRSNSCPELSREKVKSPQRNPTSGYASDSANDNDAKSLDHSRSPANLTHPHLSERLGRTHVPIRIIGGAKKRKSFVPFNGDRVPSPKKLPQSPIDYHTYDDYYTYQDVVLRRQLQQQSTSPYLLQVYDYYQQLVQRFRDHTSAQIRRAPPLASPTPPPEDDVPLDAQRKRPCRALTGKHVKQGTGASLSTLLTLRQKIQERQKAKEQLPRDAINGTNIKNGNARKNPSKKSKQNSKNLNGKVQN